MFGIVIFLIAFFAFLWMLIKSGILSAIFGFFWIWIKMFLFFVLIAFIGGVCIWIFKKVLG